MENNNLIYDENFFSNQKNGSLSSAEVIVPLVLNLVHPASVVDVGCGSGTWLLEFNRLGIEEFLGIDGMWVKEETLLIPNSKFVKKNLNEPLNFEKKFDLVVSLEVAEHLPEKSAENFVHSLIQLGDIVLFSAAIPHQGGTNHINEQWPEYWVEKFKKNGFTVIDCLRKKVWKNEKVMWWYAQNIFFFAKKDMLSRYPFLEAGLAETSINQLSLVHPKNGHYGETVKDKMVALIRKIV